MSKNVHDTIQALFASPGKTQPVHFEWRLVRRRRRPFILLPVDPRLAQTGLNLYSAQRWRAKIWRRSLPWMFQTPLAGLFESIRIEADASAEIVQFMARQAGVAAERVFPAAIKLSEVGPNSRLVLLLCDESGRPACVIKAGLNPDGRKTAEKEADFLAQLPAGKLGGVRLTGRISTPTVSAFSMDYFPGTSPQDDAGLESCFMTGLIQMRSSRSNRCRSGMGFPSPWARPTSKRGNRSNWRWRGKLFTPRCIMGILRRGMFA